jgi:TPR repeat protein
MYYHGNGVVQDIGKAIHWFHVAAGQGDMDAQCNLGFMYGKGSGVIQDQNEAVKWYRKAAEQGHKGAGESLKHLGIE